ncbi:MAG: hypothetical protein ACT6Q8_16595 [Niveispirillum sp.]|uniref:hypothetical protein n=1 Tax=Niveispirillum sp. TaxID=1917217 RepID=UPI004036E7E8
MVLPPPAPGLVVHFSYLWCNQFEQGEETGRKVRPCLIIYGEIPASLLRQVLTAIKALRPPPKATPRT